MKPHNYIACLPNKMYLDCEECQQMANDIIDVELFFEKQIEDYKPLASMYTGVISETCKGSKCWCNYE